MILVSSLRLKGELGKEASWSYPKAGAAFFSTSVPASGSFYSLCFSQGIVLQCFDMLMGTLFMINYLIVMAVLPCCMLIGAWCSATCAGCCRWC